MYNTLTATPPTWLGYTLLIMYVLGFIFCIFLKSVIQETPLKKASNPVRYGVLFLIWMVSPAVVTGLFILTFNVLFRNGQKTKQH
nr:MAG TPA: hypothetical protein [Caudoviricetes sp.]